jgi:hypothetical protein
LLYEESFDEINPFFYKPPDAVRSFPKKDKKDKKESE